MRILLTGSSGFIGQYLKKIFASENQIYEISRNKKSSLKKNNVIYIDLSKKMNLSNILKKKLKNLSIDVIIHLAYKTNKTEQSNDIELLTKNLKITSSMVELTKIINPKIFINLSSTSIYPNIDGTFDESSNVDPSKNNDFYYGLSKFNSEQLFSYSFLNTKIKTVNLRLGQVISKHQPSNRIYSNFLKSLKKNNKIKIYGSGKRIIPIVNIDDLKKYLLKIIQSEFNGTLNIVSENISLNKLAKKACIESRISKPIIEYDNKINSNEFKFVVNFSKLKKLLNK